MGPTEESKTGISREGLSFWGPGPYKKAETGQGIVRLQLPLYTWIVEI